jgi:catechol 1,2-dioxygenase
MTFPPASPARTDKLRTTLPRLVTAVEKVLADEDITYGELFAALLFLNEVGASGEMVLLSDVLGLSTNVEKRESAGRPGTPSNVEGPFWRPGAPRHNTPADLVSRDEPGERLTISGQVTDVATGQPLPGAEVDVWQTDAAGHYDQEDPALPEWHMRAVVVADDQGRYALRVVKPQAYQVPTSGPVGRLLKAIGQHPWRPAHTHLRVAASGHAILTTMAYYAGDTWLHDDTIDSVKPELILDPVKAGDGEWYVTFDIGLRSA